MENDKKRAGEAAAALFALLDEQGKEVVLDKEGQLPAEDTSDLIPLKEWAERNGISPATARQKAGRGAFRTARKIGRDWMIWAAEANPDHRTRAVEEDRLALEGPVGIREVLNYLRVLNRSTLPDHWHREHDHREYCREIFFGLRGRFTGNAQKLFDLLCRAMEEEEKADIFFVSHDKAMSEFEDEAWVTSNLGSEEDAGVTIDFDDYLTVLQNAAEDLLASSIRLSVHHGQQTMILPWYHSLSWKRTSGDGIYFVPSDFFKVIFEGI